MVERDPLVAALSRGPAASKARAGTEDRGATASASSKPVVFRGSCHAKRHLRLSESAVDSRLSRRERHNVVTPAPLDTHSAATWVGNSIKTARNQRGMTQSDLARRVGVTPTTISFWEAGKRSPGLDDLLSVAEALDHDVREFLPERRRQPARAVLRAVVGQLEVAELRDTLDRVLDEAESLPAQEPQIAIRATSAVAAAQELLTRTGVSDAPIDIDALAHACGVRVVRAAFPEALDGFMVELETGPVIGVNVEGTVEGRQRFTLAHELGHYLLRHHDRFHIDLGLPPADGNPPGYDWRHERAANDFAANVLMPDALVRRYYEVEPAPSALARRFRVSGLAMSYRLANLGMRELND